MARRARVNSPTVEVLGHVARAGSPAAMLLAGYAAAVERGQPARALLAFARAATGYEGFTGRDVVVTVPAGVWRAWLAEGDAAGEPRQHGVEYGFSLPSYPRAVYPGSRVYVVARGKLRGYAPLVRLDPHSRGCLLIRHGDAVAVTISEAVLGFQGYRYRWWDRSAEHPFPEWRTA